MFEIASLDRRATSVSVGTRMLIWTETPSDSSATLLLLFGVVGVQAVFEFAGPVMVVVMILQGVNNVLGLLLSSAVVHDMQELEVWE